MTITMTAKHQVTIPKAVADRLGLKKGMLFDVSVHRNRIELIPLETVERVFTAEGYQKLEVLAARERGRERRVTPALIRTLKQARG